MWVLLHFTQITCRYDGLPLLTLTSAWTEVSGPAPVTSQPDRLRLPSDVQQADVYYFN